MCDVHPLTLQLLEWVSSRQRTYRQTMEAWRSTCPRLSVWEDALVDGLVEVVDNGAGMDDSSVALTELGQAVLGRAARS